MEYDVGFEEKKIRIFSFLLKFDVGNFKEKLI